MIITRDLLNTASANTASEIQLGSCVTIIGNNAFSGYTNISEIEFPDSLQIIGGSAFQSCTSLTSMNIPSGVTSIGERAFQQCSGLTSIDIPDSVKSIDSYAFLSCSGLKKITVSADTPPSLGSSAFNGSTCMIYVPFSSYDAYLSSWYSYKDRITYEGAPFKVRFSGLDADMFINCNSSTTVEASDVNTKYFSGITSTTFGECVTAIGTSGFSSGSSKSLGDIVFSDSITSIGAYAFSWVSATSLSLNEGLETIGNGAFYHFNCNQPLELPSTITSIGASAFQYSTIPSLTINSDGTLELSANNLISGSSISAVTTNNVKVVDGLKGNNLRSITIHNAESIAASGFMHTTATDLVIDGSGETIINDSAFGTSDASVYLYADGSNIVNCTLGNCVTHIGKLAFAKSKIVNLTIPASVRSIGDKAFYTNYNISSQPLANVTFEEGSNLTSIGDYVFQNSLNITNISLPNSITSMGSYVFDYCTGLTTANVPSNLTSIPDGTFRGCRSLSSVTVGNQITSIGQGAFSGCSSITTLPIQSGVTSIGNSAFYGCSGLTTLTIPSSVLSIGDSAFQNCRGLTSIIIDKDTPPTIGTNVFNDSTCLIYVPSNSYDLYISAQNWSSYSDRIVAVGMDYKAILFGGTRKIINCNGNTTLSLSEVGSNSAETINVGNCTTTIGERAFSNSKKVRTVSISDSVTSIGNQAFSGCTTLTNCTIGSGVTSIGYEAFAGCDSLTSIDIPSGVTSIGNGAFQSCFNLTSINIPSGVTSIGQSVFYNCSNLTSINIPSGVTSIGDYAFEFCGRLTSIDIPSGVTSIGTYAFRNCSSLTSITVNAATPPTLGSNAFYSIASGGKIYVPSESVYAYKTATNWSNYASRIQAIPNS